MLRITLVLFIVGGTVAQIAFRGACPNIETVKNFDVRRHMGKWYETAVYTDQPVTSTDCLTTIYTLNKDGSFNIKQNETLPGETDPNIYRDTAVPTDNARNGKYTMKLLKAPYWVLATDYKNWLFLWSCIISGDEGTLYGSIYTRTRNPSKAVIEAARATVRTRKMNVKYIHILDNSRCPTSY